MIIATLLDNSLRLVVLLGTKWLIYGTDWYLMQENFSRQENTDDGCELVTARSTTIASGRRRPLSCEARELPAWRDDTGFHQLLASFESTLPLRRAFTLREARMRKRILHLTEGVTVRVCRLLEEAAVQAIVSGGERIELVTLSEEVVTASLVSISDRRTRCTVA